MKDADEQTLEQALAAHQDGRFADALVILERLPTSSGERWALAGSALIELAELVRAEESLARAAELMGDDHPDVLWHVGRLRVFQWRFDEARTCFESLDPSEEGAGLLEWRALLADFAGDHDRAHALLEEAHRIDPETSPEPVRLTPEAFHAVVEEAARALPAPFQEAFDEAAVVIDPVPTPAVVGAPASGHPPDLLGLFLGVPFFERESAGPGELPPTIFLFQRNLERVSVDLDQLKDEIHTTLYHELGHALGFDEEGVDEMGLG